MKREQLQFSIDKVGKNQNLILASLCYFEGDRLFHGFLGGFTQATKLAEVHRRSEVIRYRDAVKAGEKELTLEFLA